VVAAQDGDALGEADLERDKQRDGLDRVVATVDIVTYSKRKEEKRVPTRRLWLLQCKHTDIVFYHCSVAPSARVNGARKVRLKLETDGKEGPSLTHEEVVCVWIGATNSEQLHQVMKLAVDVAADGDRAFLEDEQNARAISPENF
jgi:hypothetical protein